MQTITGQLARNTGPDCLDWQVRDSARMAFHVQLVQSAVQGRQDIAVCDLGGGTVAFSVLCARLGWRTVLVDDFCNAPNAAEADPRLEAHRQAGVIIIQQDVIADGLAGVEGPFDCITTFDSLEHWHHSPKAMLHEAVDLLKPGGSLIIGVPNCVNARKRLTALWGSYRWDTMARWYDRPIFRGHVREPSVADLLCICRDLGLTNPHVYGRNWLGLRSPNRLTRFVSRLADYPLRLRPTLCADIYVVARKR